MAAHDLAVPSCASAGVCYTARVCSIAAAAGDRSQQQQLCSARAIAVSLPESVFMPACLKSLHDNRFGPNTCSANMQLSTQQNSIQFVFFSGLATRLTSHEADPALQQQCTTKMPTLASFHGSMQGCSMKAESQWDY